MILGKRKRNRGALKTSDSPSVTKKLLVSICKPISDESTAVSTFFHSEKKRKKTMPVKKLKLEIVKRENHIEKLKEDIEMKVTELDRWFPVLHHDETPKLCFEGYVSRTNGRKKRRIVLRTEPLDVRLGSFLFKQANGEMYALVGGLYDPQNSLPLSVKSKFKNGIPRKWQCVVKVWNNIQKLSFCRKRLRSFTSSCAWLESLKASGLLRVSSKGRIIIPSPKYIKGKNLERRTIEKAHLIDSHLKSLRTCENPLFAKVPDSIECTPRHNLVEELSTIEESKPHPCVKHKNNNNFSSRTYESSKGFTIPSSQISLKTTRRSSINQRKPITCQRRLLVPDVKHKKYRSGKNLKITYEKGTKKTYSTCLLHRRKYLLRSTSGKRFLRKNNESEPKKYVTNLISNDRPILSLNKEELENKTKKRLSDNKTSREEKVNGKVGFNKKGSALETDNCSKVSISESARRADKNKESKVLKNLPHNDPPSPLRAMKSENVLRNCSNRIRKSSQRFCCQQQELLSSASKERPKRKSENFPPQKMMGRKDKMLQRTDDKSGEKSSDRGRTAKLASAQRVEKRSFNFKSTRGQRSSQRSRSAGKIAEDSKCCTDSGRNRFSGKSVNSVLEEEKHVRPKRISNERQEENKKSVVTNKPTEKRLCRLKTRNTVVLNKNCDKAATPVTKIIADTKEHTEETIIPDRTSKGKVHQDSSTQPKTTAKATVHDTAESKAHEEGKTQPALLNSKPNDKVLPAHCSKDIADTVETNTDKKEPNLSLDDIDDILSTGAPRTLKQRKKLNKTIECYVKTQNSCTDLFDDPDYNHLIGEDTCSSQEWDTDYAEAVENLVNGKLCDQLSIGSTPPSMYLQDFMSDDTQSVRSTSPFERTPCDEEYKLRYVHRVLKERNEPTKRKSLNKNFLSSPALLESTSTDADAAYTALIEGNQAPQKLFDSKYRDSNAASDDSSSVCSSDDSRHP